MSAQRPVWFEITRISGRIGEVSLLYLHHKLHSSSSVDRIKRDGSNCGRADAIQKTQKYNSFLVTHMRTLTSLVQLKMSVNRLRLMQQKQTALAKQARRELAKLLDEGKDESARIRVENIIREDLFVEMLEILELYCELLLARFGLLEQMHAQSMKWTNE
jgi:Regulator of Vps4 activity in the MVB pathway